jgi:hypothetical protein
MSFSHATGKGYVKPGYPWPLRGVTGAAHIARRGGLTALALTV